MLAQTFILILCTFIILYTMLQECKWHLLFESVLLHSAIAELLMISGNIQVQDQVCLNFYILYLYSLVLLRFQSVFHSRVFAELQVISDNIQVQDQVFFISHIYFLHSLL